MRHLVVVVLCSIGEHGDSYERRGGNHPNTIDKVTVDVGNSPAKGIGGIERRI